MSTEESKEEYEEQAEVEEKDKEVIVEESKIVEEKVEDIPDEKEEQITTEEQSTNETEDQSTTEEQSIKETEEQSTNETEEQRTNETEEQITTEEQSTTETEQHSEQHTSKSGGGKTKVYIGNLPDNCKRSDLMELFGKYGQIERCDILKNFGFVHYSSEEEADEAIKELDDSEFSGVHIQVQYAKSTGSRAGNACFECGRSGHWARDCSRKRNRGGFRGYGYHGYQGYHDDYSSGRYAAPSRYGGGGGYGGYGSPRDRSPQRSYHTSYAYPPRW